METKELIRRRKNFQRIIFCARDDFAASKSITDKVIHLPEYRKASLIYAYASNTNEVWTFEIIKDALLSGKRVALPRVISDGVMEFREISAINDLKKGYQGIMEPGDDDVLLDPKEDIPDIIMVPGVAFDTSKNRMGHGKGFYDRYLSEMPDSLFLGLAFDCQIEDTIPTDENDIPMDMIVTQDRVIR